MAPLMAPLLLGRVFFFPKKHLHFPSYCHLLNQPTTMQFTSYYNNPSEQALLTLQVREAELRVAREELAFLQACGGVGEEDVRRLRLGLGLTVCDDVVVVKEEEVGDVVDGKRLVSLKSVLAPLIVSDESIAQLCRRVRPIIERRGVQTFRRRKAVHVMRMDVGAVVEVGRGVVGSVL